MRRLLCALIGARTIRTHPRSLPRVFVVESAPHLPRLQSIQSALLLSRSFLTFLIFDKWIPAANLAGVDVFDGLLVDHAR